MNKFTKQCVAAFASLAMAGTLCVAGAVVANNVAFATGADQTAAKPAPWSDQGKVLKGKITINKEDASNNNKPLGGATFTIQKVTSIKTDGSDVLNVDLTSEDGWTKLAAKVKQLNTTPLDESKLTLDQAKEKTTGTNGKAEFDNLDLGLYLVKEKSAPTGYTTDVKPFFMTVPEITREATAKNNTYTYDVSVSPKNTNVKNNVTKTADNGKIVGAGDTLPYTITATVNKKKSDAADAKTGITKDELQGFAIYDDAVTAAYDSVTNSVVKEVKIVGQSNAMVAADYNVTSNALVAPDDANRTRIKVKFTDAGLTSIASAVNAANGKDVKVTVKLEFKLKKNLSSFVGSDKKLTNKSGFVPGHGVGVPDKPIPGGDAETEFRKFHIKKVDATDKTKTLNKAEFKAFADQNEAKKCAADPTANKACDGAMAGFTDIAQANTEATITTTGVENSVSGVTKDYVAKVTDANANSKIYLVEVKAPDGYARSEQPHEVSLTSDKSTAAAQEVEIVNVPTKDNGSWFNLPKTGAAGVIIFALAGMCLVAVGMFIFLRNRKKDEEQQAA